MKWAFPHGSRLTEPPGEVTIQEMSCSVSRQHLAAVVFGGPRMTFQIGDKVVYPNQGVGTIENISTRSFGSNFEKYYLLRLGCTSMTVVVPFSNAADIGLRRVTQRRAISRVLSYLSSGWCPVDSDWKARCRENTLKMASGDLLQAAQVFKGLLQLLREKPLSLREKKMLERARHMLLSEVSMARGVPEVYAAGMLARALGKAGLALPAAS